MNILQTTATELTQSNLYIRLSFFKKKKNTDTVQTAAAFIFCVVLFLKSLDFNSSLAELLNILIELKSRTEQLFSPLTSFLQAYIYTCLLPCKPEGR